MDLLVETKDPHNLETTFETMEILEPNRTAEAEQEYPISNNRKRAHTEEDSSYGMNWSRNFIFSTARSISAAAEPKFVEMRRKKLKEGKTKKGFLSRQFGSGMNGYSGEVLQKMQNTSLLEAEIRQIIEEIDGDEELDFESELEIDGLIGKGAYGEVYKGYIRGEEVAVKRLEIIPEQKHKVLKAYKREIDCLQRASECERIIPIYGAFITSTHCCLIMPFMEGGSLAHVLHEQNMEFSLERRIELALEIAEGMRHLHSLKPPVVHRDLSTQNILFHPNDINEGHVYIADFGIALVKRKRTVLMGSSVHRVPMSPTGHPRYRAPEVTSNRLFSKRADVYMFGTVLYELILSQTSFPDLDDNEVAETTASGRTPQIPNHLPTTLKKMLTRCWRMNPKRRPPFKDICKRLEHFLFEMKDRRETLRSAWS